MPNDTDDCKTLLGQEVRPGDLIKAELINCLLDRVNELDGKVKTPSAGGPRTVPNLFGQTLAQSRTTLKQPTLQLKLGRVLDPLGQAVNLNAEASQTRIVIGQMPQSGTRVDTGSKIDVLLSATVDLGGDGGGEEPATGFIQIDYKFSPEGTNVVLDEDDGRPHVFEVINNTNKELTVQLTATATANSGDWSDAVDIQDIDTGDSINSVTIEEPGGGIPSTRQVNVVIAAPDDAVVDEEVTLTVTGNVPAPHNKTAEDSVKLDVADEGGEPVTRTVAIAQFQTPVGLDDVGTGKVLSFIADIAYNASEAPLETAFNVVVEMEAVPAGTLDDWPVLFGGGRPTNRVDPHGGTYTTPVSLVSGANATRVIAQLRTPTQRSAAANKVADLTMKIVSTNLPEEIESDEKEVTVTLKKA